MFECADCSYRNILLTELHGPPMSVDKTDFGLVRYNHANFYRFEVTFSYWSVKRISVFVCFSPVRITQSVGHLTHKSEVLGSISGLATYFRFSFR